MQVAVKTFESDTPGGLIVRLAYSDGNHYDSIMTKDYRNNSAICQCENTRFSDIVLGISCWVYV